MLRRFFSYYRPYKHLFLLDFACAVVAGLLELGFPLAVNQVVDKLLPQGNWSFIILACCGLLAIYAVNTLLNFVVTYWGHMLGINIETDMRSKMFNHLQKLSFRFFDNNKTGQLMSRISNDLLEIGEVAHHGPEDLFIAVMTLIGALILMLSINVKLALLTFTIVPLLLWMAVFFNRKMVGAFRGMMSSLADINARVEDNIGGIRVVQAFANEEHEKKLFAVNNGRFRIIKLLSYKIMAWNISISYILMRLVTVFVLICGTWFVIQKQLTYGEFIAFILLTNVFLVPIQKINTVIESYPKGIAGFKRYVEIIDTEPDVADAPTAIEAGSLKGEIRYQGVTFRYENEANILTDIDLSIHAGETVAFVGPSGAGKTTLCSLLPRFYDIAEGSISIDGTDIRDYQLVSLRRQIGIVQQDVFLFSGTIRENISYGNLGAGDDEIWEAARRARLETFIQAQPNGLETIIGERGVKLSGGQKQRLAIARMFLKNPPILILDEATSALDTETEAAIQQSLAELSEGRTTLVIAHRLATIRNADRIVVVTEQGIMEQGPHEELLALNGVYSRLHQAQFRT
ncbi:multidrug ABC transporter ATP-binding protein [Paenibacillus baekrokdamisoli]|uniref:Multidrug ABC transporter ATP-binding protein n=1 Tax=Paenibacillus baekrokdamisoli TaxID=1712516 RepID=A0A3G9JQA7_9BACL|nr:ABC transporter ATP-binding protein [Paenibacillus baekrokdamisoli]MBB3069422.1 ATP-binding cassette subfamily B protein [Paenibacillus baekrokdamisoli]BBH25004.1 multidrug ABC transporter ATP-binding protein [Paenibacillus baekrokdamisoli]